MHTETLSTAVTPTDSPTAREFGVGGRITLAVMSSDYASIILGALAATDSAGLEPTSDEVSTWVTGDEAEIADYFVRLIAAASAGGEHVSATVMFSRGCPGEISCELPPGRPTLVREPAVLAPIGVTAVAQWALYPLNDGGPDAVADHMRDIYAAIDLAKNNGTFVRSDHYVTRLEGDLAQIMESVVGGWLLVGRTVSHVTTHLTISVNSPRARAGTGMGTDVNAGAVQA